MHRTGSLERQPLPEHQLRVDRMLAQVRAEQAAPRPSIFKPPPPRPAPSENPLDHRIAEEIEVIRRRLEQLGGVLIADPILLNRHGSALQSIDLINQILGHLGSVIATRDKEQAVERISLTELAARLKRKPLAVAGYSPAGGQS